MSMINMLKVSMAVVQSSLWKVVKQTHVVIHCSYLYKLTEVLNNGVQGKKYVKIDLGWIRNGVERLDGECILMEGEYHLYNIVDY